MKTFFLATLFLSALAAPALAQIDGDADFDGPAFTCDGGETVISTSRVNDGYVDCEDGTDEVCEGFLCADLSACIPREELDGNYAQCGDSSDLVELKVGLCVDGTDSCTNAACSSPTTRAGIVWNSNGEC